MSFATRSKGDGLITEVVARWITPQDNALVIGPTFAKTHWEVNGGLNPRLLPLHAPNSTRAERNQP